MTDLVTLYIDDQLVSVPKGMVVVDAAKKMGTDIPVFCYHPKLEPVGMCRMCLVEIGRPKLDPAPKQVVVGPDGPPANAWGTQREKACAPARRATGPWRVSGTCWNSCPPRARWTARSAIRAASARCRT